MHKPYPNHSQSWGVLGIAILTAIIFSFVMLSLEKTAGKEVAFFVYYVLSMGTALILVHFLRRKMSGVKSYPLKPFSIAVVPALIIALLGLQFGITMPLADLIPMPDALKEVFRELNEMNGVLSFISIAIAAPVLEEFIFRGIVLEGLLRNYSPRKAILISSFLFGIVHLNPWQFISAMAIGCLAGWVYYRSRNLWLPILIHFANNSLAFLGSFFVDSDLMIDQTLVEIYGGRTNYFISIGIALTAVIVGVILLNKQLTKFNWSAFNETNQEHSSHIEEGTNSITQNQSIKQSQ